MGWNDGLSPKCRLGVMAAVRGHTGAPLYSTAAAQKYRTLVLHCTLLHCCCTVVQCTGVLHSNAIVAPEYCRAVCHYCCTALFAPVHSGANM